jgi:PAT family beta-lactamase induction signal transducer AmpG
MSERPKGWRAVWLAMKSRRTASVSLLSFSSGLPLGLVWIAIPTWLAREGVDIRIIGLFTLAQAPWTFKFVWSPFMDRYKPPVPKLQGKLGWTLFMQVGLLVTTLALGGVAQQPDAIWIVGALTLAIAFASASQDIAIDAYAVEILRPNEQGIAVGARTAVYRAAMYVAGGVTITLAGLWSWPTMFAVLAVLYLPMMVVTMFAPRPEAGEQKPPRSLRAAVWEPFLGFMLKRRALEILAFVILYKLADNLATALVRPFLVQVGFNNFDVGIATATIGLIATLFGTFVGGALTTTMGLGRALWVFGVLQVLANFGYVAVASVGLNRPLMYSAMGFESLTTGMGTGAFSVLLLRMTQKEFSATQYALFSSLFALPRLFGGPITGIMVDAIGWRDFFLFTIAAGVPGLLMLQRFSPLGSREPQLHDHLHSAPTPLSRAAVVARAVVGGILGTIAAVAVAGLFEAVKNRHLHPQQSLDWVTHTAGLFSLQSAGDWLTWIGIVVFALTTALVVAAWSAARSGWATGGDQGR